MDEEAFFSGLVVFFLVLVPMGALFILFQQHNRGRLSKGLTYSCGVAILANGAPAAAVILWIRACVQQCANDRACAMSCGGSEYTGLFAVGLVAVGVIEVIGLLLISLMLYSADRTRARPRIGG